MSDRSTESLFHYTRNIEFLIKILKDGFKYRATPENLPLKGYEGISPFFLPGVINHHITNPVVCFCDIPFKYIFEHLDQYGEYGIGLSKEWGMKMGVTPIRYIHFETPDIQDKRLYNAIIYNTANNDPRMNTLTMIVDCLKNSKIIKKFNNDDLQNLPIEVHEILKMYDREYAKLNSYATSQLDFIRAYSGDWIDRVTNKKTHRVFYDEREWRAVKKNKDEPYLTFDYSDITHIIIKSEVEKDKILSLNMDGINDKIYLLNDFKNIV